SRDQWSGDPALHSRDQWSGDPALHSRDQWSRGGSAGASPSQAMHDVVVGGPLCESGDIFTQEEGGFVCKRSLPVAGVGDYLIIERAGAYGFVMASNYNSKPMPPEVLIQGGKAQLIRARQTSDDLTRGETIPG
ncbi:MAG: hypothetical protein WD872_18680, partial [Pirellulaceae bacterium]